MTAYNAADTIERAVGSALAQTWQPLEILIVDDGSTDGTRDILARLEVEHPNVRVILHDSNQGTAVARNTIIDHAQGEAIAFFDDDDISHPERLKRQWARLTAYEQLQGTDMPILCFTGLRRTFQLTGTDTVHLPLGSSGRGQTTHGPRLVAHLLWGARIPQPDRGLTGTCIQMARRETYLRMGGFDARFRRAQDSELNVRVARAGGHLIGVPEPLVDQEMVPSPDRTVALQEQANLLLIEKHRDAFPSDAVYGATRRWVQARHALRRGDRVLAGRLLMRAVIIHPSHTLGRAMVYLPESRQKRSTRKAVDAAFRAIG